MEDNQSILRADDIRDFVITDTTFNQANNFAAAHLNVRSLNTGFDELCWYIDFYQFDILGLSETWLSPVYENHIFEVPGYNFVRRDREGRGGGVGMYIKKTIQYSIVTFNQAYSPDFEYIAIKFMVDKKTF